MMLYNGHIGLEMHAVRLDAKQPPEVLNIFQ